MGFSTKYTSTQCGISGVPPSSPPQGCTGRRGERGLWGSHKVWRVSAKRFRAVIVGYNRAGQSGKGRERLGHRLRPHRGERGTFPDAQGLAAVHRRSSA